MSTKTSFTILVVAAIIVIGFILFRGPAEAPVEEGTIFSEETETEEEASSGAVPTTSDDMTGGEEGVDEENIVIYTESGYSPSEITVRVGDTVTWRNESSGDVWTASAIHPTHKVYPGTDISLCFNGNSAGIFDACNRMEPGSEWSFTFDEAGRWGYHNHVRASHTGRVIVE